MKTHSILSVLICLLSLNLTSCIQKKETSQAAEISDGPYYSKEDFSKVSKYDVHVHINLDDTTFVEQAKRDNFKLITVNVNPSSYPEVQKQRDVALKLKQRDPEHVDFATTFTVDKWGSDDWESSTLAYLKESFDKGAVAVKIWKNIGMELRDKDGRFVMIDDPRFDKILDFIEKNNITLLGHLGEPKNAWLPVEQMTVSGDKNYFTKNPKYHMFLHPEYPSYEDQINARDKMLEKHPGLRFVGAHLGSLEWDVDQLAKRLDKFPNMAVEMAARISHLQYQSVKDKKKVIDFFTKYQDRILYGTDHWIGAGSNLAEAQKGAHDSRLSDWMFLATDNELTVSSFEGKFTGLHLPKTVVDKIYRENTLNWFPGIK